MKSSKAPCTQLRTPGHAGAKYCMEDPDGAGPVTGKMVAEEAVRLWCIRDVSARERGHQDGRARNNEHFSLDIVHARACFARCR